MKKWKKILSGVLTASMILAIPADLPVYAVEGNAAQMQANVEQDRDSVIEVSAYLGEGDTYLPYNVDAEIYQNGIQFESEDTEICTVNYTCSQNNGWLSLYFRGGKEGSTRAYLRDNEGNILREFHITVSYKTETVYMGYPKLIVTDNYYADIDESEWTVTSSDSSVCIGTVGFGESNESGNRRLSVQLEGKGVGTADITVKRNNSNINKTYHVSVENTGEHMVIFEDANLLDELLNETYTLTGDGSWELDTNDLNDDGYLSESEMAELYDLYLPSLDIRSLEGLQYAVNVNRVNLSGNTELENIEPLMQMENLSSVNLDGTKVSDEDKMRLSGVKDEIHMEKGRIVSLYQVDISGVEYTQEVLEGKEFVEGIPEGVVGLEDYEADTSKSRYILGKEVGEAVVRVTCGDFSMDVNVQVTGATSEQPLGNPSDREIIMVEGDYTNDYVILDDLGRLWDAENEFQIIREGVKQYISGSIYSSGSAYGEGVENFAYVLDENNTLWSGEEKLAENVESAQGHYALMKDGTLIDIYNDQSEEIENVEKWWEDYSYWSDGAYFQGVTYILKKDGTLWQRIENEKNAQPNELELISADVVDFRADNINEHYVNGINYLKKDGQYIWRKNPQEGSEETVILTNAASVMGEYHYQGLDGNAYIKCGDATYSVGNVTITDSKILYVPVSSGGWNEQYYYLTDEGELFQFVIGKGSQLIAEHVTDISIAERFYYTWQSQELFYLGKDGLYRDVNGAVGSKEEPHTFCRYNNYGLQDYGVAGDYNLCNAYGAILLTHVKDIYWNGNGVYALRTDGTVWNVYDPDDLGEEKIKLEKLLDLDDNSTAGEMSDIQIQEVLTEIASADSNDTVSIDMASAVILPAEILKAAQEKDVAIVCNLSDGTVWEIDGSTLAMEDIADTDLTVVKTSKDTGSISGDAIVEIAGNRDAEQLNFTGGGAKMAATLSIAVDQTFDTRKCLAVSVGASDIEEKQILGMAIVENDKVRLPLEQTVDCALIYAVNGDTSGDERVNITDLMQTLHFVSGRSTLDVVEQGISDVDLNGYTNITDLMKMLHFVSGRAENL